MKSHCINGHPYDDGNRQFRPDGSYACRTCNRDRHRYYTAQARGETPSKPYPRAAERILDLLLIDAGWLTCPGIAMHLGIKEATVSRALFRLRRKGILEERIVEMAGASTTHRHVDSRREWRHTQAAEAWAS